MKSEKTTAKEAAKAIKIETVPVKEKKTVTKPEIQKTAAKKPTTKKPAVRKQEIKETIYLQYSGKELNKEDIIKKVKEYWTKVQKNKVGDMKSITLYLKPEENAAYFVINGDVTGSVEL